MNDARIDPPLNGDEKATLLGFLQFLRASIVHKCNGLTEEQLRSTPTVSSMSLLGMLKHLTIVERYWFQGVFLDAEVDLPWSEEDPDADWRTGEADTASEVVAAYARECEISDRIITENSLDKMAAWASAEDQRRSLRWIVVHMIEETGRHAGHADILRESIDGQTGE